MRELGSPAERQWQTRGMLPFLHCYRACHSDSESSSPSPALLQSKQPLQLQINSAQVTVRLNKGCLLLRLPSAKECGRLAMDSSGPRQRYAAISALLQTMEFTRAALLQLYAGFALE